MQHGSLAAVPMEPPKLLECLATNLLSWRVKWTAVKGITLLLQFFSGQRVREVDPVDLPQLIQRAGPFVTALVARLKVPDDHNDGFVRLDVLIGDFLHFGLGHGADLISVGLVVIHRLAGHVEVRERGHGGLRRLERVGKALQVVVDRGLHLGVQDGLLADAVELVQD